MRAIRLAPANPRRMAVRRLGDEVRGAEEGSAPAGGVGPSTFVFPLPPAPLGGRAGSSSETGIGVEAAKKVIPEEGKQHRAVNPDEQPGGARAVPAALRPRVEIDGGDEPG